MNPTLIAVLEADGISLVATVAAVIGLQLFQRWRARRRTFPGFPDDGTMPCLHCPRCHSCYRLGVGGECVTGSKLCPPCSRQLHHLNVPPEPHP